MLAGLLFVLLLLGLRAVGPEESQSLVYIAARGIWHLLSHVGPLILAKYFVGCRCPPWLQFLLNTLGHLLFLVLVYRCIAGPRAIFFGHWLSFSFNFFFLNLWINVGKGHTLIIISFCFYSIQLVALLLYLIARWTDARMMDLIWSALIMHRCHLILFLQAHSLVLLIFYLNWNNLLDL